MYYTYFIIAVSCIFSFLCFNNERLYNKFILYPYEMHRAPSEYYRVITSGLIHANWTHLLFNMLTLYFFGPYVESILGGGQFVLFYVLALAAADLSTLIKYKNHPAYRSLGASGAVAAVIFAYIYVNPWSSLYIFFAIPIPAIVFAVLYILYSIRMSRMQADNINHDAHLYGALFGLLYMLVFVDPSHGFLFIERLKEFSLFH